MKQQQPTTIHYRRLKGALLSRKLSTIALSGMLVVSGLVTHAQDLYIKDTPSDNGTEPNPDPGPMWVSDAIWVRTTSDPNYSPLPFPTSATPTWALNAHQNPEYRPTKFSTPNWIYVQINNRGTAATTGTEKLELYWAKASTGLAWPNQWVDYFDQPSGCSTTLFLGEEATKTRKNAAFLSATERTKLLNAILALDQKFYNDGVSYWDKQDDIHEATHVHGGASFLTWHRELINRFELLLREVDPTLRLHYWDWTTDPRTANSVNLFSNQFMGNPCGGVTSPFAANFSTDGQITRSVNGCSSGAPSVASDLSIVSSANSLSNAQQYQRFRSSSFSNTLEANHNNVHGYIGGTIGDPHRSFEDPFVYLLHSDVDKLFAMWQRDPNRLWRLDPAQVYGTETSSLAIQEDMEPWEGSSGVEPWTTTGGEITVKNSQDPSVVSPPFYDTAPLTIPVLQPGESVVIQLPWYPPNPADYACFGGDKSHFCLLARVIDGTTLNENNNVGHNTKYNNNIAWKNITIVDMLPNGGKIGNHGGTGCVSVRNTSIDATVNAKFSVDVPATEEDHSFFTKGAVRLDLGEILYNKWVEGGKAGNGIKELDRLIVLEKPGAWIGNIALLPEEAHTVCMDFSTANIPLPTTPETFNVDLKQWDGELVVGGERFTINTIKENLPSSPVALRNGKASDNEQSSFSNVTKSSTKNILVFPNPAKDEFSISVIDPSVHYTIIIYDVLGREAHRSALIKGTATMKVSTNNLQDGMYQIVLVNDETGERNIEKIIVNKQ